jgi:hypothetical protein
MVYIKAWADFQDQAEALYSASPAKVGTNLCINPCPHFMFCSRVLFSHLLVSIPPIHPTPHLMSSIPSTRSVHFPIHPSSDRGNVATP